MIQNQINMKTQEDKENLDEIVSFANRFIILILTCFFLLE